MYAFLILLLRSNELFHSQEPKTMFMLETVQSLREEISTIFCARDMRSADSLGSYQVSDGMPPNVYVLGSIVKNRIIRQCDRASIVSVNVNWVTDRYAEFLTYLPDPCSFLASDSQCVILSLGGRQGNRGLLLGFPSDRATRKHEDISTCGLLVLWVFCVVRVTVPPWCHMIEVHPIQLWIPPIDHPHVSSPLQVPQNSLRCIPVLLGRCFVRL